ncbi:MAG TPA: nitrilase-related carbon-nitrogen hydrolase [Candidatus Heimdallarchaeota archaeon]|nr:nitrilase-related carbon-nitrogen hydrolase [Candidatus Heimdallarchaeota archaeon]
MWIGYVQTNPIFGEVRENLRRARELISRTDADLWVLPELFATGYQFVSQEEANTLAEPVPDGTTTRALIGFARERDCFIVAGLAESAEGNVYNSAVLVGPDGLVACYRKVHLFSKEKLWFTPGDTPFPVSDIGCAKIGVMICFDHLFPESARSLALNGAEIIAHPSNLIMPVYAQLTMRARALENGVFTVTANRVGVESRSDETLRFTGESQIVSPAGEILARSPAEEEDVRVIEIDPAQARDKSLSSMNDRLADRRPDLYVC